MTLPELIVSAEKLKPISYRAAREYAAKAQVLAAGVSAVMTQRHDLTTLVGEGNDALMDSHHQNHAIFMGGLFAAFDAQVFVTTVNWSLFTYKKRGFRPAYWEVVIPAWKKIIASELPPDLTVDIMPLYDWLESHIPKFPEEPRL